MDDSSFSSAELKFDLGAISTADRGMMMAVPPFGVPSGHGAIANKLAVPGRLNHRGDAGRFYVMLL